MNSKKVSYVDGLLCHNQAITSREVQPTHKRERRGGGEKLTPSKRFPDPTDKANKAIYVNKLGAGFVSGIVIHAESLVTLAR